MRQSCKLVKGTVISETSTVGPRHDPYSRTTVRLVGATGNPVWELIICGLAGVSFREFNGFEAQATEHDIGGMAMDELVEKTTGMPIDFWLDGIWEYQQRAMLAKYGPEQYAFIQECLEADAALLRYAM